MKHPDELFPELPPDHSFVCASGCGVCKPVQIDFEYLRSETLEGELIESKTCKIWVSNCCKSGMAFYNDTNDDWIEYEPKYEPVL